MIEVKILGNGEFNYLKGRDGNSPYLNNDGIWMVYDDETRSWINTGIPATGPEGYTPIKGVDYFTEEEKLEYKQNSVADIVASFEIQQLRDTARQVSTDATNVRSDLQNVQRIQTSVQSIQQRAQQNMIDSAAYSVASSSSAAQADTSRKNASASQANAKKYMDDASANSAASLAYRNASEQYKNEAAGIFTDMQTRIDEVTGQMNSQVQVATQAAAEAGNKLQQLVDGIESGNFKGDDGYSPTVLAERMTDGVKISTINKNDVVVQTMVYDGQNVNVDVTDDDNGNITIQMNGQAGNIKTLANELISLLRDVRDKLADGNIQDAVGLLDTFLLDKEVLG